MNAFMTSPPADSETTSNGQTRLMRLAACAVIVAGAVGLLWPSSAERPFAEVLQEARSALAESDFARARQLTNQLLQDAPDSTDTLLISGQASLQLGCCSEGERTLRQVLALDPVNVEAHQSLIRLLKMEGRQKVMMQNFMILTTEKRRQLQLLKLKLHLLRYQHQ